MSTSDLQPVCAGPPDLHWLAPVEPRGLDAESGKQGGDGGDAFADVFGPVRVGADRESSNAGSNRLHTSEGVVVPTERYSLTRSRRAGRRAYARHASTSSRSSHG
jgi:hypothetical protein